jgi:enoyl-CoA hydratase/carnithine racemase
MKKSVYRNIASDPLDALDYEAHNMSRTRETDDYKEGIRALLEKRRPEFAGR